MFFFGITLVTIFMAIYIVRFAVLPLPIPQGWKMVLAVLIFIFSQKTGIVFLLSPYTSALNTEVAMAVLGFFFAFIFFLFLCTLFVNILGLFGVFIPLAFVFAAALSLSLLGVWFAVRVPGVHRLTVDAGLKEPYKIVQLTDLHIGSGFGKHWLEQVVAKTNALNPDVVVITGDIIDGAPEALMPLLQSLANLKAPVYMVYGNHEYYYGLSRWAPHWAELKVRLLENESVDLGPIVLGGVGMPRAALFDGKAPDIEATFAGTAIDKPRVLMAHYPETFNESASLVTLQLSGHTHGGQLFWPFNLFTKNANKGYLKGVYKKDDATLYISEGTGLWGGLPLRLGTMPEITEIILK